MTDSRRSQPDNQNDPLLQKRAAKLAQQLTADMKSGDLDHARTLLRMTPPDTSRAALVALGAPYLKGLRESGNARLGKLRGAEAAEAFINNELRPIALRIPRKVKPPSPLRKLVKSAAKVALLVGLSLPMLGPAPDPSQGELSSFATPTESVAVAQDIKPLLEAFAQVSMGRDMLAMAEAHGVKIVYDPTLSGSGTAGSYQHTTKVVRMDPAQSMSAQVMYLAHELRHAWQDNELQYGKMESRLLTPNQQWTLRRYLEADAFAFSAYFMAVRMQELPDAEVPKGNEREIRAAKLLHAEFSSDDGLTGSEYKQFALDRMFNVLGGYNDGHLRLALLSNDEMSNLIKDVMEHLRNGTVEEAVPAVGKLQDRMATTPSQEAFEEYLRRFGGTSLSLDQPTALQERAAASAPDAAAGAAKGNEPAAANVLTPLPEVDDTRVKAQLTLAQTLYDNYRYVAAEVTGVHQELLDQVTKAKAEAAAKKAAEQKTDAPPATPQIQSRFTAPEGNPAPQQQGGGSTQPTRGSRPVIRL